MFNKKKRKLRSKKFISILNEMDNEETGDYVDFVFKAVLIGDSGVGM